MGRTENVEIFEHTQMLCQINKEQIKVASPNIFSIYIPLHLNFSTLGARVLKFTL